MRVILVLQQVQLSWSSAAELYTVVLIGVSVISSTLYILRLTRLHQAALHLAYSVGHVFPLTFKTLTFEDSQVNQWVGTSSLNQQHTSMTDVQSAISCTGGGKAEEGKKINVRQT